MKYGSTLFLKGVIMLIGFIVLAICLFALPVGLRSDASGFYRPIILGLYVAAIPFFSALYQAFQLLSYIDKNSVFSVDSVHALKYIKYYAYVISGIFALGMPYIFYVADKDDAPGVAALGFVIIGASFVIAVASSVFQRLIQNAVDLKIENDLTV